MTNIKRMLSLILALTMVLSMGVSAFGNALVQLTDIDNHWAKEEINFMTKKGVIEGYDDGTFKPDNNMTKVEFYKVINHLMGYEAKAEEVTFEDVKETSWFYDEVAKALAKGYIKDGEKLNPNELITREEVARIIGVAFELDKDAISISDFTDKAMISIGARGYVGALKEKGYIEGYSDGTFGPKRNITRAEVVKMLFNIFAAEGIPEIVEPKKEEPKKTSTPATSGGGGGGGGGYTPSPSITGIHADHKNQTVTMHVYGEYTLPNQLKVTMSNNTTSMKSVTWSVQEDEYVGIDGYTVTANRVGEYTLEGTVSSFNTTWTLNVIEAIEVGSPSELVDAINEAEDGDIIKFTNDITSDINLNKLVNLDLNNMTLTGNVVIDASSDGTIELSEGTITGNLIVNAPNATVNNRATVEGTITIENVAEGTWNENADGNTIVVSVKIVGKKVTINIGEGSKVKKVTLNTPTTLTIPKTAEVEEDIEVNGNSTIVSPNEVNVNIGKGIKLALVLDETSDLVLEVEGTGGEVQTIKISEVIEQAMGKLAFLTDNMFDDEIYRGDEEDSDGNTTYSLATLIMDYVNDYIEEKNLNYKIMGVGNVRLDGERLPYGSYAVEILDEARITISKDIVVDTITVNTAKGFRDILSYDIKKVILATDIILAEDIILKNKMNIKDRLKSIEIQNEERIRWIKSGEPVIKEMTVSPATGTDIAEDGTITVTAPGADELRIMLWAKELADTDAAIAAYSEKVFSARTADLITGKMAIENEDGIFTIIINEALITMLEAGTKFDGAETSTSKYTWKAGDKTTWLITPETEGELWEEYATWDGAKVDESLFVYTLGTEEVEVPVDTEAPVLGDVTLENDNDENLVLTVKASDNEGLATLEVDHSLGADGQGNSGIVPEFTVGTDDVEASEETMWASSTFADGTWTLNFGPTASQNIRDNATEMTFYFVITDVNGNKFGSMSPPTAENTRTFEVPAGLAKAITTNVTELQDALTNEAVTDITIDGTIGSESGYIIYTVNRAVTIQGAADAKVFGTFIVKADGVTIKDLAIQNKGDKTGESSTNRGGIYVFANNVTLTNNTITNGLGKNAGLSNGIQVMRPSNTINTESDDYVIEGNTLVGHAQGVPNWSSSGIVVTENNSSGTAGGKYYGIKVNDYDIATKNTFTSNQIDYVHQDWANSTLGTTKYAMASNVPQLTSDLESALTDATILVNGTLGDEHNYTIYTVAKDNVTIKGLDTEGSKVYGTFIIKADGVTIDGLGIQNKGDLTGGSSTNRGGIYVYAKNVTLTNNIITNGLGSEAGLSNAIQIMSPTANNPLLNYTITGNELIGHDNEVPNWSSSGIVIAQGYKPGSIGEEVKAITATEIDYTNLLTNNTFENNKIDLTHQDWTTGLEGGPVLYPYPVDETKALVRDQEKLKQALEDEKVEEITVEENIGSEYAYTIYNVDRPVTIKGTEDAKVFGTFIIKADDVTIQDLAIENQGDPENINTGAHRGAIYVYADSVTIKGNTLTSTLGAGPGITNGIQLMRKSETINNAEDYVITGNTITGFGSKQGKWGSAGIVITQGFTSGTVEGYGNSIEVDYVAIESNNTFTDNEIDLTHQDWSGLEGGPVLYPYPVDETDPVIKSATVVKDTEGNLVLTVVANDANLYSLEVDHSHGKHGKWASANLPEFHVYADAERVYGKSEANFVTAGLTADYDAAIQTWTLTFAHDGQAVGVINNTEMSNGAIDFFLAVYDEAGNSSGDMDGNYLTVSQPAND